MAEALYSQADYQAALLALLPTGRAWPKDPDSVQAAIMDALALGYVRFDARAQTLLVDAFPASTVELLPEWEATLDLPDACEGEDQTLQQRQAQVLAKLVGPRGQSVAFFLSVLESLGYTRASITQFAPFRADVSAADTPVYSEDWTSAWQVNLPDLRVFYFSADISAADEPLISISNDVATCVINALKPAHTTVIYTNDPAPQLDFRFLSNLIYGAL